MFFYGVSRVRVPHAKDTGRPGVAHQFSSRLPACGNERTEAAPAAVAGTIIRQVPHRHLELLVVSGRSKTTATGRKPSGDDSAGVCKGP